LAIFCKKQQKTVVIFSIFHPFFAVFVIKKIKKAINFSFTAHFLTFKGKMEMLLFHL